MPVYKYVVVCNTKNEHLLLLTSMKTLGMKRSSLNTCKRRSLRGLSPYRGVYDIMEGNYTLSVFETHEFESQREALRYFDDVHKRFEECYNSNVRLESYLESGVISFND